MRNAETGLGKGFAFVRYVSADAAAVRSCKAPHVCSFARVLMPHRRAQAAVEHLNGLEVCGRATKSKNKAWLRNRLTERGFTGEAGLAAAPAECDHEQQPPAAC